MGQQQLLLIILGIIIVGIAIAIGITVFNANNVSSNRDNLTIQLGSIAADAFGYYQKAKILGGGGGTLIGYTIMRGLDSTLDGSISITYTSKDTIKLQAVSKPGFGTVSVIATARGIIPGSVVYTGEF